MVRRIAIPTVQSRHDRHRANHPRREPEIVVEPVRYRAVAIRTATGRMIVNRPT
ncbi:hypothetical protein [Fodinicola feengrottensis]|uniref:Uncharacterized protein n=2 Tax=Fodinicola feengrottensis TaxID=435914 RepID=A0ABN2H274_9ACTN|nr:hypothetical protein [Fodinicola feengrottensis]